MVQKAKSLHTDTMKEIERKFILAGLPDIPFTGSTPIRQGYITDPSDSVEARLRQKGDKHLITFKRGSGMVREEREIMIDPAAFKQLWHLTRPIRTSAWPWMEIPYHKHLKP